MTSSTDKIQAVTDGTTSDEPEAMSTGSPRLRRMEAQGLIQARRSTPCSRPSGSPATSGDGIYDAEPGQ